LRADLAQKTGVSVVLPTYNRVEALCQTFPRLLELEDVAEIIVVNDGSTDTTDDYLARQVDPRLRVIRHAKRKGSPAARNRGVAASRTDWILFAEDDCFFPVDYALVLRDEAALHGADVVAAPWLNVPAGERRHAVQSGRAAAVAKVGLDAHPSSFPAEPLLTPFLPALALVRRDVFERICFFEGFRGNAYREETDFFISAVRSGFVCVLSPATASFQASHWTGGQRTSRLRYEYWIWRNNRLFLRRHGSWLREHGYLESPLGFQLSFARRRLGTCVQGSLRARQALR
jgi:GT2 family glycosyltransferase